MDNGSNFKNWFDAIWLGDEEHGQFIPNQKDEDYDEYLEKFTLSYGAYKYALSHSKERIAELEKAITEASALLLKSATPYDEACTIINTALKKCS